MQRISVTGPVSGCTFPVTLGSGCGSYVSTPTGTCPTTGNKHVRWLPEE